MADKNNLLRLFDRPREPVFVPKGEGDGVLFDVPSNFLTDRYKDIGSEISTRFGSSERVRVNGNVRLPDLKNITKLGRDENFSLWIPAHRACAMALVDILMGECWVWALLPSLNRFLCQFQMQSPWTSCRVWLCTLVTVSIRICSTMRCPLQCCIGLILRASTCPPSSNRFRTNFWMHARLAGPEKKLLWCLKAAECPLWVAQEDSVAVGALNLWNFLSRLSRVSTRPPIRTPNTYSGTSGRTLESTSTTGIGILSTRSIRSETVKLWTKIGVASCSTICTSRWRPATISSASAMDFLEWFRLTIFVSHWPKATFPSWTHWSLPGVGLDVQHRRLCAIWIEKPIRFRWPWPIWSVGAKPSSRQSDRVQCKTNADKRFRWRRLVELIFWAIWWRPPFCRPIVALTVISTTMATWSSRTFTTRTIATWNVSERASTWVPLTDFYFKISFSFRCNGRPGNSDARSSLLSLASDGGRRVPGVQTNAGPILRATVEFRWRSDNWPLIANGGWPSERPANVLATVRRQFDKWVGLQPEGQRVCTYHASAA